MQVKEDKSFGVVPVWWDGNQWKVLIIHQISYRGKNDTFWIFPKGHAEAGETSEAAAKRELAEETGVVACRLEAKKKFSMHYSFRHEGMIIDKTVEYFIGYCDNQHTEVTQPHEVKEVKWATFTEAKQLLAHKNSKDILDSVVTFLAVKK